MGTDWSIRLISGIGEVFSFSLGSDSVLSLVIRALSVSVRSYVSVCTFALFSFALLAGSRNF